MLALITAVIMTGLHQPQDTLEFRVSYAKRKGDYPTETPDPAIQRCMDLVMAKVRQEIKPSSPPDQLEKIAGSFSRMVADEDTFPTEYSSIGVNASWAADRVAIGVRMGAAARLGVFRIANGAQIPVPKELRWSYQYAAAPMFAPGGLLVVDGMGIQDAGVRYGYRIWFLRPGEKGYSLGRVMKGIWTLADADQETHLELHGPVATVRRIDPPKAFFTDSVTRIHSHMAIYVMEQWPFKVRMQSDEVNPIQTVDKWMVEAMKSPKSQMQKDFAKVYGNEPRMLGNHSVKPVLPESYEVTLEFDEHTYVFTVHSTGFKMTVTDMKIQK